MQLKKGDRVFVPEFECNGTVQDADDPHGPGTCGVTLDKPAYKNMWTLGFFKSKLFPEKL